MNKTVSQLTVYFEDPFWGGVCERSCGENYEVCRIVFGAEPKDFQVYDLLVKHWSRMRFSSGIAVEEAQERKINPKHMQRAANRQMQQCGIGTKAQQALKQQQEQGRQARKIRTREQQEAEKERQFALHEQKRREKHRGH